MNTKSLLNRRLEVYMTLLADKGFLASIEKAAQKITLSNKKGGKLLIFGNGGSAAQSQHFSAELVGRFKKNRRAFPALSLTTDTSIITAQANDAGYETIFSRQIEALATSKDVVIGLTTSDVKNAHSQNIKLAFDAAKKAGAYRIGIFSSKTKTLLKNVDLAIIAPATETEIIQEIHLLVIHLLCEKVEESL